MAKKIKAIICAERTADGPRHFAVDSEKTFDELVELSECGSNEADMWGGFEFDVDMDDDEWYDADGDTWNPYDDSYNITMIDIDFAKEQYLDDLDDDDEEACEEAYEEAFMSVRWE